MADGKPCKKSGIMGGTFNPIHYGHLLMAQRALEEYALDEVLFIPTGLQWMKIGDPDLLSGQVRQAMTELAIADNPAFRLSDMEIRREGNTYTYETFLELKKTEPDTQWYYIVGEDTLYKMDQWRNPKIVFENAVIICARRGGISADALDERALEAARKLTEEFGADIRMLSMPLMEISSTDIRERVKAGKSIRYMLPDPVIGYIDEQRLYLG